MWDEPYVYQRRKHSMSRGHLEETRSSEECLESSENRKKANILKQSVEGEYKCRKTMGVKILNTIKEL